MKQKKKIFILLGHPNSDSFCGSLFHAYIAGAKSGGHEIKTLELEHMNFEMNLKKGYKEIMELEPCLKEFQENIQWANHIVFIFPTWWVTFPGKLKGLFDRAILPGFGFHYHKTDPLWDRLLKGKSARLITTMDGPKFTYKFFGSPGIKAIKYGVLMFCGINPVRTTICARLKSRNEKGKKSWIEKINRFGKKGL